jgi:hypothetical protein
VEISTLLARKFLPLLVDIWKIAKMRTAFAKGTSLNLIGSSHLLQWLQKDLIKGNHQVLQEA